MRMRRFATTVRTSVAIAASCAIVLLGASFTPSIVQARVTRLTIESETLIDLPTFGATGSYRKIRGTFEGEIDPRHPRNAEIVDLDLAPRVGGRVRYQSTFYILTPADPKQANRRLLYLFNNRGSKLELRLNDANDSNDPTTLADFGNGWLNRQGYTLAWSGWDPSARRGPDMMTIDVPVARRTNGRPITATILAESSPASTSIDTMRLPYPASRTARNGVLTLREREGDERTVVTGWQYLSDREISFPAPTKPQWLYEFIYEAKDPLVLGLSYAATRDFITFLRTQEKDDHGTRNPVSHPVDAVYSFGRSQAGRVQRDFLYWGFNEQESTERKPVIDAMMAYATGAGLVPMNERFGQPSISWQQHVFHRMHESRGPHTFPVLTDPHTGKRDGILRRCLERDVCPKFFNVDSASEYWNKTSSLNHTDVEGNDLDIDRLAPNVRLFSIASLQHSAVFGERARPTPMCQQLSNPLYQGPVFRALLLALDQWVTSGTLPPASHIPTRARGSLVAPRELRFPTLPATNYTGFPALPGVAPNLTMNRNFLQDRSVIPSRDVPDKEYIGLVSQVDADGNEIDGVRLPLLAAPLGTYTGWNRLKPGMGAPDLCGLVGQFIPFASTRSEREAAKDPRPSIEERYPSEAAYREIVSAAAEALVRERLLLPEDAFTVVADALEQFRHHRALP